MHILQVHNFYQQPGGEDAVCAAERQVLQSAGHQVSQYTRTNSEILQYGIFEKATLPLRSAWAWDTCAHLAAQIRRDKPDLVHFHNTFPLISPAAYVVCHEMGIPSVQTIHNYRLLCPAATLYRDGHRCEECVDHSLWRGVLHGCYRGSRPATAVAASMLALHRIRGSFGMVGSYIALTEFSRQKLIASGLVPETRVVVKPNFLAVDPGVRLAAGDNILFVGRLAPEKGLLTLLRAMKGLSGSIPIHIVGDGPLSSVVQAELRHRDQAGSRFLGQLSRSEVLAAMRAARVLIFPSEWYECFPLTVLEAFASGVPVICAQLGAMKEIVTDGHTGRHFSPGDAQDLAAKIQWAWSHPHEMEQMGRNARSEYETKYTSERNYQLLMDIYSRVLQ